MDPLDVPSSAPRMSPSEAARQAEISQAGPAPDNNPDNILQHRSKALVPPTLKELPSKPLVLVPENVVAPSTTIGQVTSPATTIITPSVSSPAVGPSTPQAVTTPTPQQLNSHTDEAETTVPDKSTVNIPLGLVALGAAIVTIIIAIVLNFNISNTKLAVGISAGLAIISLVVAIASFKKTRYPNVLGLIALVLSTATLAFMVVTLVSVYRLQ